MRRPRRSLADYVAEREEDVPKLLEETPIENLQLDRGDASEPRHRRSRATRAAIEFVRALRQLDADFVLLDLGAGTDRAVMDYFMVCDDGIVVLTPEPTSVENAYSFMRAAFYRRLRLAMLSDEVRELVGLAMDERNERGIRTPFDLLREVEQLDADRGRALRPRDARASGRGCVVNDVRSAEDIRLGFSVRSVCRRYFAIDAEYLGYVNHTTTRAARCARCGRWSTRTRARTPRSTSRASRASCWSRARAAAGGGAALEAARGAGPLRGARRPARARRARRSSAPTTSRGHLRRRLARRLLGLRGGRGRRCCASASSSPIACSPTAEARRAYDAELGARARASAAPSSSEPRAPAPRRPRAASRRRWC